jgi:hypothetical protein
MTGPRQRENLSPLAAPDIEDPHRLAGRQMSRQLARYQFLPNDLAQRAQPGAPRLLTGREPLAHAAPPADLKIGRTVSESAALSLAG